MSNANEASKPAAQQTLSDGAQFFACYLIDNCENEVVREESVQAWLGKMLASPRYHPAAPSVEQDERGAFRDTLRAALKSYRRANPSRYLNDDQVDASDSEFVSDLMTYVPVGEKPRAASTSANVAQGAVAVVTVKVYETYTGQNGWTEVTQEEYDRTKDKYEHRIRRVSAPPAQTALTDDARDAARWRWFTQNYGALNLHEKFAGNTPRVFTRGLKGRSWGEITRTIDAALTAAQSASGDTK